MTTLGKIEYILYLADHLHAAIDNEQHNCAVGLVNRILETAYALRSEHRKAAIGLVEQDSVKCHENYIRRTSSDPERDIVTFREFLSRHDIERWGRDEP